MLRLAVSLLALCSVPFAVALPSKHASQTASNPTVELDYGTFRGALSSQYNLTYFRKIPFAASTAGQNRFRAPQSPLPITNGTYDSNQAFDMCPQRTVNGSEDCLYLGIYSRPWTKKQHLRPVLLTFYGGGFIRGGATFDIPPSGFPVLNVSSSNDYVVVYSNYRTNVFGFLPGSKIAQHPDVDLNPGLLDQKAALQWIHKHIHHFGGNKNKVTIWGQSAGGGSVVAQTIATGNRGKKLFTKAMASSPFWPKTYRYNSPWAEALYQQTLQDVGCNGTADEIACLKDVNVQKLRDSALKQSTSQQYTTSSFTYGPVIDTNFLTESLSEVIAKGHLNADTVLTSYNLHEGENFIPPGFSKAATGADGFNSSATSFDSWLRGYLPDLTAKDLASVKEMYPAVGEAEEISWNTTYIRAGLLYRDIVLACPAFWMASKAEKGWIVEYTISPAKHASDVQYWNTINPIQKSDPLTYQGYAGAQASFIQTGDPNAHKVTNASVPGVPGLDSGKQFLVSAGGLKQGGTGLLEKRCGYWKSVAGRVPV
ncbi:PnbA Carboxylesterase type B [Pyrenophora tritici-repentis]|uniref:Carboxylic ester hydrolase n=1 Tax=Pyrenophora tritici-repentis TaxID=45151 RepID=A0A2W1E5J0_9PLEO|nr:PnbA Carboxylesterase type B [Pyrenophora tritici-repentis]KAF7564706.1 PnbA, Carboxylesterase type B [Pyrenophora tritici-repentis]KAI0577288.1 PnbA Carboxylesterase type B [Pyrenophora tritici-repentis]KAI0586174.1 PnbA Carboxylesterase type B [Pyrenophora tritici-repentis]KAI0611402.1 PnbA Carboxylesterase type B [Pyrenophora tritici-repentis]